MLAELELYNVDEDFRKTNVQRNKQGLEQKVLKQARLKVGYHDVGKEQKRKSRCRCVEKSL